LKLMNLKPVKRICLGSVKVHGNKWHLEWDC
jgi:hypothetical protein